ncbi:MAG: glycosyl transferase [uncultured bacterium]|nr:MAG: glycosyl transferase [uncultured bacterium]
MADKPKISIITATLNAEEALKVCYEAIAKQSYPKDKIELIIGDGGSEDKTRDVAKSFGAKIANNPLKTAEAGKAAALKLATGSIVAIIDSDNVMPNENWLKRMTEPFQDPDIIASEPWEYTYRREDSAITRYSSLIGMNDPLCLFLGNYDRKNFITNKWTAINLKQEDKGNYLKVYLSGRKLPTIGANGFVIRMEELKKCSVDKYVFDIDLLYELIQRKGGKIIVAKVKTGIIHLYCDSVSTFIRKQKRRVKDFFYFGEKKEDAAKYPWMKYYLPKVLLFCLACVTIVPLLIQILIGYSRKPDYIWWFHFVACWITLWLYGWGVVFNMILPKKAADRSDWKQTK